MFGFWVEDEKRAGEICSAFGVLGFLEIFFK